MPLKRQSTLKQKAASLRDQLSAAVVTLTVALKSKITLVWEHLAAGNNIISKLRAKVQTDPDKMDCNRHRVCAQYSRDADMRLRDASNQYYEVLAWMKGVKEV